MMCQWLIDTSALAPAKVHWNKLKVDENAVPTQELGDVYDCLLFARFPNGVALSIDWFPDAAPGGEFVVELVEYADEWEPFAKRTCRSFAELRSVTLELIRAAKAHPAIAMAVFEEGHQGILGITLNELVLDQTRPPSQQIDRLKGELFEATLSSDRVMKIGWEPPHDPTGEFVVRLLYDPERVRNIVQRGAPSERLLLERRCRTISELESIVQELTRGQIAVDGTGGTGRE